MIRADAEFDDRSEAFLAVLGRAEQAGIHAAAQSYSNDMKKALRIGRKGYVFKTTTGNVGKIVDGKRRPWSVGYLWNTVTIGPLVADAAGWALRVGTNVAYALYWELGHHNIYTKHYERDPKWVPTYLQNRERYAAAFRSAFRRVFQAFSGKQDVSETPHE